VARDAVRQPSRLGAASETRLDCGRCDLVAQFLRGRCGGDGVLAPDIAVQRRNAHAHRPAALAALFGRCVHISQDVAGD
jgi:hypothetical protein